MHLNNYTSRLRTQNFRIGCLCHCARIVLQRMSGRINHEEMADMYATVDLSKKKQKKKASTIATSEAVASADMYAVVDRKGKSKETKISTNSEWAAAVCSEMDPSKINESPKHTCVSSNSLPGAQVENGLRAHFQKFKLLYALAVVVCLISLIFLILFIILFVRVASLESTNTTTSNSLRKEIKTLQVSNNEILHVYNNHLLGIAPGYSDVQPSCAALLEQDSSRTSGYYFVRSLSGQLRSVYCDMRRTCGNITGGWMRVAVLDVQNCPLELKQKTFNDSITTCVVREEDQGCTSIFYSSLDIPYSRVCGRIRAYKVGTPDGFTRMRGIESKINNNYLDGISITINTSTNRTHVWSFAASVFSCTSPPSFVDNDFACDSSPRCDFPSLCGPLLWKSQQYESYVSSWLKELSFPHVSDIEVRVCRDQIRSDEDLAITTLELYVQ